MNVIADPLSRADAAYMTGFGNSFATEALPGALPIGRNSPQRCPYGLYAEQLSGSPFTAPRAANERSWLYRLRPSVRHVGPFAPVDIGDWLTAPSPAAAIPPAPLRWLPFPLPEGEVAFPHGVRTVTTCGDAEARQGMAAHVYGFTRSMDDAAFYNADAEMMWVPQRGALRLRTEFGAMGVRSTEIAVIPRGVKFRVELRGGEASGYLLENYGAALTLPERGPIGANCLANQRDFETPVAAYEDSDRPTRMFVKWGGRVWGTELPHSPLDVVAWHGNYAPYRYDLRRYSPVGPVLFDHADPSIFTVLTSPSGETGTANIDFVIFPDRWLVAEDTFRPPWYHMNIMSEFMGLIEGQYDAKPQGFLPGGVSLHNCMLPHGPDAEAFERASTTVLAPQKMAGSLAFMFETFLPQRVTPFAAAAPNLDRDYMRCWSGLGRRFDASQPA